MRITCVAMTLLPVNVSAKMIKLLIAAGLVAGPVSTVQEAEQKYGKLDGYIMPVEQFSRVITKFNPEVYNVKFRYNMWVNKDMVLPLALVFLDLQLQGLLWEITKFNGCYNGRSVRGRPEISAHAYGLACDFDDKQYSERFVNVWEKWGFCWGGKFKRKPSRAHFAYSWECKNKE